LALRITSYKKGYVKCAWGKLWRTVDYCPELVCMLLVCNVILRISTLPGTSLYLPSHTPRNSSRPWPASQTSVALLPSS